VVPVDCCLVVDDPVEEMCLIVHVLAFRQRQTRKLKEYWRASITDIVRLKERQRLKGSFE
jgi:hypothetical protein